jgi:hypothetical protein
VEENNCCLFVLRNVINDSWNVKLSDSCMIPVPISMTVRLLASVKATLAIDLGCGLIRETDTLVPKYLKYFNCYKPVMWKADQSGRAF